MPSDRTIARAVLYVVVAAAALVPLVLLHASSTSSPRAEQRDGAPLAAAARDGVASGGGEGRSERHARLGRGARDRVARESDAGHENTAPRVGLQSTRQRDLAAREARAASRRGSPNPGADSADGFDPEREAYDEAQRMLRSADTAERLDGVDELAADDPDAARREAENILDSASEDRWDVYDKLIDLAPDDDARIGVALRALGDSDAEVRDQAAYWLSTEDGDRHPQILQGLRSALAREQDESARDSIESALESLDLEFVPEWLSQLDAETDEPDVM